MYKVQDTPSSHFSSFNHSYTNAENDLGQAISFDIKINLNDHKSKSLNTIYTTYRAHKRFLHREVFPSDAHRGVHVMPTFVMSSSCQDVMISQEYGNVYISESPLLMMPIPDFSMPFNVVTLVRG
jgi:hypothetical protein